MEKRWETKQVSIKDATYLSKMVGIPLPISKLLVSNGINNPTDALQFLKPDFKTLHNPFLMTDMEIAVKRIISAIENDEKILVYGDYDADGVTTLTVFVEGFKLLGIDVDYYAPNRFVDGYGLNPKNIEKFAEQYDLIISGDTGIKAFSAGEIIENIGKADLIVTDHHEPLEGNIKKEILDAIRRKKDLIENGELTLDEVDKVNRQLKKFSFVETDGFYIEKYDELELVEFLYELGIVPIDSVADVFGDHYIALPKAHSVINPKRLGDIYPCKSLSGVAVVFKLFQAIFIEKSMDMKPLLNLLDVVSVGLVADLVQQIDKKETKYGMMNDFEVRVMTAFGIKLMNKLPKPWVKAISEVTSIKIDEGEEINSSHLGFRFGPMLNAPGRLYDPKIAVELLLEKDPNKAIEIAKEMKEINTERQSQIEVYKTISSDLKQQGSQFYDYGIVVKDESFHIGIAGLISGKLCEEYYRPSIALAPVEFNGRTVLKGSARSIPGVNVEKILGEVQKDIGKFEYGGHEQAAGMTIELEQFEHFRESFRYHCKEMDEECFIPLFKYDAEIEIEEIFKNAPSEKCEVDELPFMKFLSNLEPYGMENREPVFRTNKLQISELIPIMEGKGYRLTFKTNCGAIKAISFKGGEEIIQKYEEKLLSGQIVEADVLYNASINVWQGKKSFQMMIQDMKILN